MSQRDWVNKWINTWEDTISYWKNNPDNLAYPLSVVKHVEHFPQKLRDAISANDIDAAITLTAKFVAITHESGWVQISKDLSNQAVKENKSDGARKAANARHAMPLLTVEALKKEFRERLEKSGQDAKPTTIYKDMAEEFAGGRNHWRKIKTRVEK